MLILNVNFFLSFLCLIPTETSPSVSVKGCKFRPVLDVHDHAKRLDVELLLLVLTVVTAGVRTITYHILGKSSTNATNLYQEIFELVCF